jgi:hypothetical protein
MPRESLDAPKDLPKERRCQVALGQANMLDDQRVRSNLKFPRPSSIPEECCPQELAALVEHALFDDLVRPRQHRLRDRQAEGAGGLQVDH